MRRPTIKDVANMAGVSVGLVSMVLNAKRDESGHLDCPVKESTAQKVMEAVAALDYKMNRQAAGLRSGRHKTIAVILPDISNKFFADIASQIEKVAYNEGYIVIFCSSSEDVNKLTHLVENFYCNNVDGMIIAPCAGSEEALRKITEKGLPVICLDRVFPGMEEIPSITLDNIKAGVMAADAFHQHGCKHIGVICFDTRISTLTDRLKGFVDEAHACGMDIDVRLLAYHSGLEEFKKVIVKLLENGVDALFLPSNNVAVKALVALHTLDIAISEKIAFIGFDECEIFEIAKVSRITQSTEDFGRESFGMLLKLIEGESVDSITLEPTFVKGE